MYSIIPDGHDFNPMLIRSVRFVAFDSGNLRKDISRNAEFEVLILAKLTLLREHSYIT